MQQLSNNTLLQGGKYRIKKVLGQGGFGITYLATQELLDRKVCIKEFFYKEYCERDEATSHVSLGTQSNHEIVERFLNKFLKEARTISQLEHPNIIKIHDIFKENNTAYYVMDYIEGQSLSEMVKQKGALSENIAVDYIKQIASALDFIHQRSINHLDVKPANIMVRCSDNKTILIDFGLSKQYDAQGGQTSSTPVGISHGYAPMEQYKQGGVSTFSPETDIYALGATLYKMVTGDTPPQAMDVMNDGLPTLPASLSSSVAGAIKKAIQPRKVDRFQNVDEFLNELKASSPASPFIQEKREEKPHQIVDEETKVLNNSSTKAEEKKIQKEEDPQPSVTFVGKDEKKDNTAKIGCSIFLVLGCIVLFFLLRECNGGGISGNRIGKQEMQRQNEITLQANQLQTTGKINGHEYVDLGLSVKWATCNIGASSPSDYGSHFAWGETSTKTVYTEENNITWEVNLSDIAGNSNYDAAHANWGGSWRLPRKAECQELVYKCTWTWTIQGGHNGYKVVGPNGNSIFLPAAGYHRHDTLHYNAGLDGHYWSSTPDGSSTQRAYSLRFHSSGHDVNWSSRFYGWSIRPVSE